MEVVGSSANGILLSVGDICTVISMYMFDFFFGTKL